MNREYVFRRLKYKTRVRGSKGNTFVLDASEREYTITGLDVNTQYLVRMAVVNHNGTGPYSDWLPVATSLMDKEELILGPPRELRPQAGVDYIVISWLPPADESNIVRGYQIGWGINVPDISMERVGANVLQHKITGLRPAKEYVISLRAFNKQGSGFPIYETVKEVDETKVPCHVNACHSFSELYLTRRCRSSMVRCRHACDTPLVFMQRPFLQRAIRVRGRKLIQMLSMPCTRCAIDKLLLVRRVCCRNSKNTGYTAGKKASVQQQGADLWIDHPGGNNMRGGPSDYMVNGIGSSVVDMKHLAGPDVVESPPPSCSVFLRTDSTYGSVSVRHSRTPARTSISSYDEEMRRLELEGRRPIIVGRAKPILASVVGYGPPSEESQGTLSRSYHHSQSSLEGQRQRTPQVVYTGSGRHQPIAKIEFGDSPYGSTSALEPETPPVPLQAPPVGPPVVDGYRTLRGGVTPTNQSQGPLRSFTQLAGTPPPPIVGQVCSQQQPRAIVVAAGGRQLPVGRATAQPRVNVTNIYRCVNGFHPSNSTEELNAQMENLEYHDRRPASPSARVCVRNVIMNM
ncbi:fibronectin type III domain protein [Cooperia oncophora]